MPLRSKDDKVWCPDDFERGFIAGKTLNEKAFLFDAAASLGINPLQELCAASIASYFKDNDFEKVKDEFGLGDISYTPEDDDMLVKENEWLHTDAERKLEELIVQKRNEGLKALGL